MTFGPYLLFILISISFSPAYSGDLNSLCPFCHENHIKQNDEIDDAGVPEHHINIDHPVVSFAIFYPCLAGEIRDIDNQNFWPIPIRNERTVVSRKGQFVTLSKEQLFDLLYIASINSNNIKIPMTLSDYHFFAQIITDKDKEQKYAWLMGSLFIFFSAAGALANFFSFINIYDADSSVVNTNATLWLQNVLMSLVTFLGGFLSSMTNFSWAEFHLKITENFFRSYQSKLCELDNKFRDLSYTLIELSFMNPIAAKTIANIIDENALLQRLQISEYGSEVVKIKWLDNFLSVVDCIKSDGKWLPKSLELQSYIKMHY